MAVIGDGVAQGRREAVVMIMDELKMLQPRVCPGHGTWKTKGAHQHYSNRVARHQHPQGYFQEVVFATLWPRFSLSPNNTSPEFVMLATLVENGPLVWTL
jgi:hypothetical protein